MAPLVSCLCVTRDRLPWLIRAIDDYLAQTWADKELLIVQDGDGSAVQAHVDSLGRDDIRVVTVPPGSTLGALRNRSIGLARGELLCQWDDDDRNHPERITCQADRLLTTEGDVCLLTDVLHHVTEPGWLFYTDWRKRTLAPGRPTVETPDRLSRTFPGTLMLRKGLDARYPESGTIARAGEDWEFLQRLAVRYRIVELADQGHLYVYTTHGQNTWSRIQHLRIAALRAIPVPEGERAAAEAARQRFHLPAFAAPDVAWTAYLHDLAACPPSVEVHRHRAILAMQARRLDDGARELAALLALDSTDARAWCDLAGIQIETNRPIEARRSFAEALRLDPLLADAWAGLGFIELRERRPDRAEAALRKAIELRPLMRRPWRDLITAIRAQGRSADEELAHALARHPTDAALLALRR